MKRSQILGIYFWSILNLRLSMIVRRVIRAVKGLITRRIVRTRFARRVFGETGADVPVARALHLPSRVLHEPIALQRRAFIFLNEGLVLPAGRDERRRTLAAKPLLWQFHYGYHDYLPGLLEEGSATPADVAAFIEEWRGDFPPWHPSARAAAWHPYVLALRIDSWIRLHALFAASDDATARATAVVLARGVEDMTRALLRNLEFATMANHLLKNIKALVLAGCFLGNSTGARARKKGLRLLERELREQVLADGMHFERSPMYHLAMTADMLDLLALLREEAGGAPVWLESAVSRMLGSLRRTLHPDGRIAIFNDSVEHGAVDASEVLRLGEVLLGSSIPEPRHEADANIGDMDPESVSGLLVHRAENLFVIFDGGLVGPDYQPGHAHCDTLSYEVSWGGRRFITDTGVFHYRESPERNYCRSTAAHNTVRIDTAEQSEVWKSFRVGRRARVPSLHMREEQGLVVFQAAHDGYRRIENGLMHERCMAIDGDRWICVVDFIHGSGRRLVESVIHFHPDVVLHREGAGLRAVLSGQSCAIRPFSDMNLRVFETEYYPAFGRKQNRKTAVFHGMLQLPARSGYALAFSGDVPRIQFDGEPACSATLMSDRATVRLATRLY